MTIQNVKKLVKKFETNTEFRVGCYKKTPDDFLDFLNAENLSFDFHQMEDALRVHVLSAQSYSDSSHLFTIYDTIRILLDWPVFEFDVPKSVSHF